MAESDAAVRRSSKVLWRWVVDGLVILGPDEADPVVVRGPGAVLWSRLAQERTVEELVSDLAVEFATEDHRVFDHVRSLCDDYLARGWIEVV